VIDTLAQALVEAGRVRLRQIMLTAAATTVLGVLPLATGYARRVSISTGAPIFL
jgi:multidrug efflux pump subunit AcrB